jgi:hypothetical protein
MPEGSVKFISIINIKYPEKGPVIINVIGWVTVP